MELIDSVRKHIKEIGWYQDNANFSREIEQFISANENLSESELLEKIYSIYGTRIKFLEEATRIKYLASIKSWINFFGILFIISLVIGIIYAFANIS